ncbi:MAG: nicotinate (nicotinamide) nucleotide adenylyltransferase [Myxococcota bacterium]
MTSTRRTVGLFGGSFNPPHMGHTLASLWVLQTQAVDELWWMPTYQHAFGKELASYAHRMAMCALAVADLPRVSLCAIEERLGGESRTFDTVAVLKQEHPSSDFALVIGTDILDETGSWKNWDGLMEMVSLIVVGRRGYGDVHAASFALPNISSTTIRAALAAGDTEAEVFQAWMVRDVQEYVVEHGLYR